MRTLRGAAGCSLDASLLSLGRQQQSSANCVLPRVHRTEAMDTVTCEELPMSASDDALFAEFADISDINDSPQKRQRCDKCSRPKVVCWCPYLPERTLDMTSKLYILQHPNEEKRCLRTARILEVSCQEGQCEVIRSKKFSSSKFPQLNDVYKDENTFLLFPSVNAVQFESLPPNVPYNILIIDGTWSQARSMYHNNPELHKLKKVEVNVGKPSTYVIRTQPTEGCLSTVETAAIVIAHVEARPDYYDSLTKPLHALCSFQLDHGATHHYSKEYLIINGLYDKPVTKKIKKKLKKHQDIKTALL